MTAANIAYSIHHSNFPIRDKKTTEKWYGEVFGLTRVDPQGPANADLLMLTNGRFDLHFHVVDSDDRTNIGITHFAVEVTDWDEFHTHLDGLDVQYIDDERIRVHNRSKTGSLIDPDGHRVEFTWHPDRAW